VAERTRELSLEKQRVSRKRRGPSTRTPVVQQQNQEIDACWPTLARPALQERVPCQHEPRDPHAHEWNSGMTNLFWQPNLTPEQREVWKRRAFPPIRC